MTGILSRIRLRLTAAESGGPIFLMCACEDGQFCHRRDVGELLKRRGYAVKEFDFGRA